MRQHDLAGHEEPQPETTAPLVATHPRIGLEQDREVLGGDALAVVAHLDLREPTRSSDADVDRARSGGVLDRVGEEVEEDLLEAPGVAMDDQRRRLRREPDVGRVRQDLRDLDRFPDELHDVDRFGDDHGAGRSGCG